MHKLNITNEDINIDIEDTDKYIKYIEKLTNINWKVIPDFEDYIISEYGDIITLKFRNILNPSLNKGYYRINLSNNYIKKDFGIHRLVYKTFIDQDIEDFDVHHKDENKLNNHYSNLQKMTKSAHSKYHHDLENEEHLKEYKKYYIDRYENNLSTEEIMNKYNVLQNIVHKGIKIYRIYLYLDKDLDKYNKLTYEERNDLYTNIILIEDQKKYLAKCEEIYNLYYYDNKSIKEIAKLYNIPIGVTNRKIREFRVYLYLDKDLNRYNNLSDEEEKNIYNNKIIIEDKKSNDKKYLEKCKKFYDLKYKDHLFTKKISKKYNIPKYAIERMIKQYKIYLYLNKDLDKYSSLSQKEKNDFYTNIVLLEDKKNNDRKYLKECKKFYDLKYKNGLFTEEISKKYNIPKYIINKRIRDYKVFLYLNKDIDKFSVLSREDIRKLEDLSIEKVKKYLKECKKFYDLKYKDHLFTEEISKKYNIPKYIINKRIRDQKLYYYLNEDFDKFYELSYKERDNLYRKFLIKDRDKKILNHGKKIEKLKLTELSHRDIADKLNMTIGEENYYYRKYKELLRNKEKYKVTLCLKKD